MSKFFKSIGNIFKSVAKRGFSPFAWISAIYKGVTGKNLPFEDEVVSLIKGNTGSGLTTAQIEQNEWNSQEAQTAREWEERMDNTKYQRQTQDMLSAGLNPALMYGGSVSSSAPSAAQASGSSVSAPSGGLVNSLLDIFFASQRMRNLRADAELKSKEGQAALINAWANFRNAGSNERQAGASERRASVEEARVNIEKALADKDIEVKDSTISKMAAEVAYTNEMREFISKNYELAVKNADSLQRQSIAALRQADAAIQNAATQSEHMDYQNDLLFSQTLLNEIVKGEHSEIYKALPDRLRYEVDNLRKQGLVLDEQKRLVHRQGNYATAATVKAYVSTATDVAKTVASFIPGKSAPSGDFNMPDYLSFGIPMVTD